MTSDLKIRADYLRLKFTPVLKKTTLLTILLFSLMTTTFGQINTMQAGMGLSGPSRLGSIKGYIKGFTDKSFLLVYDFNGQDYKSDTVYVKDDKFSWSGKIAEPKKALMMFSNATVVIFLEPVNIKVEGRADSLSQLKIAGSKTQDEARAYAKSFQRIRQQIDTLNLKISNAAIENQPALKLELDKLKSNLAEADNQYIRLHPNSPVSLSLVSSRTLDSYESTIAGFDLLGNKIRSSITGKELAKRLVMLKRTRLGEQVLDFAQDDPDGKPVKFSDFKGKYVFIDFWASWCGPCRAENPNLLKAYNQFKANNFTVIGVSLDDKIDLWKKAIKDDNMPWAQVSDLKGWKNELSSYYGIGSIPSSILVDPEGKVIAKDLRGEELHKKLAEIFSKSK